MGPHWGFLAPGGAELQTATGGVRGTQFSPAPLSCSCHCIAVFHLCHRFPVLSLAGGCFPPSPFTSPPVPIGLRLTLCRWGGHWGGGAVPLSAATAFPLPSSPGHVCWKGPERGGGRCGVWASPLRQRSVLWGGAWRGCWGGGLWGDTPPAKGHSCWNRLCCVGGGTLNQGVCVAALPIRGTHWGGAISGTPSQCSL